MHMYMCVHVCEDHNQIAQNNIVGSLFSLYGSAMQA